MLTGLSCSKANNTSAHSAEATSGGGTEVLHAYIKKVFFHKGKRFGIHLKKVGDTYLSLCAKTELLNYIDMTI